MSQGAAYVISSKCGYGSLALCPYESFGSRFIIKEVLSKIPGMALWKFRGQFQASAGQNNFLLASWKAGKQQCKCQDASALSRE